LFYNCELDDPERAAFLVQALADQMNQDSFLNKFVKQIDGRTNILVHSTIAFPGSKTEGAGDMPTVTGIDSMTYSAKFSILRSRLDQLTDLWVQGTETSKQVRRTVTL